MEYDYEGSGFLLLVMRKVDLLVLEMKMALTLNWLIFLLFLPFLHYCSGKIKIEVH